MGLITEELSKLRIKCVCFGGKSHTKTFAYIFDIHLLAETVLAYTDNLNKTLQSIQMTAVDAQVVVRATVKPFSRYDQRQVLNYFGLNYTGLS